MNGYYASHIELMRVQKPFINKSEWGAVSSLTEREGTGSLELI